VRAAIEFFGVEWIGDRKSFFEQVGPLVGSLIVAGVAGFAAWLAARTANERQREQLDHDAERRREQLKHDREMRDRDFARQTLSSSLENLLDVIRSVTDLVPGANRVARLHDKERESGAKVSGLDPKGEGYRSAEESHLETLQALTPRMLEFKERSELVNLKVTAASADNVRIRAALGRDSDAQRTHWDLAEAVRNWFNAVTEVAIGDESDRVAKAELAAKEIGKTLAPFEEASREALENFSPAAT